MTEPREKHLKILKRTRLKRNARLIAASLACISLGAVFSWMYYQQGDLTNAVLTLLPFAIIFPWGLTYLALLARGKHYTQTQNMILAGKPLSVQIENLDAISGDIQLRSPEGVELFQVDDPAFGLINAISCELRVFEKGQQQRRKEIAGSYTGKKATLYPDADDTTAVLFVNDTAIRLKRITSRRLEIRARTDTPPK
ncbi:MAG: hypothetical protein JST01_08740 [Cyanobacteria bacterium SZAS TMP-1]|nr:hypothetical protein [Cyanobacteria bacterium SZAS TMP-1]